VAQLIWAVSFTPGFSPVIGRPLQRYETVLTGSLVESLKPLKRLPNSEVLLFHRAEATV
jgi:hypothetical protein